MPKEISAGAILYRKNKEIKYLLLHKEAKEGYKEMWDFPKGNVEDSEDEKTTVKREIEEETGIRDIKFEDFEEKVTYFYRREGKIIYKEVIFYLVETKEEKVKLSEEHQSYKWADFDEAFKLVKFKNSRILLIKAEKFLKKEEE